MITFKIVFTLDVFFSAETTMHCKVTCILYKKQAHKTCILYKKQAHKTCILYKKQAHFRQLLCLQVRSVTP